MSEGKPFLERTITADPKRFKSAEEKLSDYQKKTRKYREKQQQEARQEQSAPKTQSRLLSSEQELALSGINEMNNRKEIASVKNILDITPTRPVPVINTSVFTPDKETEEEYQQPVATNLNSDFDFGFDLHEKLPEEKGGRKRKSRKLRKSPKKSRKSKRKTTRKNRRHRRR
jgi:hypothetical protein